MKKYLISLVLLMSISNSALAYNDYGYSYGLSDPYSGGFSSSMHLREMQNDFDRQQALNQPGLSAVCSQGNRYFQQAPASTNSLSSSSSPSRNADRDYVQSKPLSLKGVYLYDGYGN